MAQALQDRPQVGRTPASREDGTSNSQLILSVTPGMMAMLERLSSESEQPLDVVITRSIALYRAALDARLEGKHVGYAGSPEGLHVEFVGPEDD